MFNGLIYTLSYSIPPIVLCPWLTLKYCVKVEKSLRLLKCETIAWPVNAGGAEFLTSLPLMKFFLSFLNLW